MSSNPALLSKIVSRQRVYQQIRDFFAKRQVLEVETPILEEAPNPSPFLEPISCNSGRYMQSSPEFYMKRLLAAGSGDIFQICKAFRADEVGRWHRPEFSILEWYRVEMGLPQLQDELLELLALVGLGTARGVARYTYGELFGHYLAVNPYLATTEELQAVAKHEQLGIAPVINDRAGWLELLFNLVIEPKLADRDLVLVEDFPEEFAMLARLQQRDGYRVAARFELYSYGVELANAFWELRDPLEQAKRFGQDLQQRRLLRLDDQLPWPGDFLASISSLPDCVGIALGLDRLLALVSGTDNLAEVLLF